MSNRIKLNYPTAFPMVAIIFSDDPQFATKAVATLTRVGRRARVNVRWTTKLWPINTLNQSALAQQALVDASDALLILFSETQAQSLPTWVFDWLDCWARRRSVQDAAVGVIRDESATSFGTSDLLCKFARKHGLSFIVDEKRPPTAPVRFPVQFTAERMIASQSALTNPSNLVASHSYRSFGINE